jgi:hypothetical protein
MIFWRGRDQLAQLWCSGRRRRRTAPALAAPSSPSIAAAPILASSQRNPCGAKAADGRAVNVVTSGAGSLPAGVGIAYAVAGALAAVSAATAAIVALVILSMLVPLLGWESGVRRRNRGPGLGPG